MGSSILRSSFSSEIQAGELASDGPALNHRSFAAIFHMNRQQDEILDWSRLYQDSLTREILRSERSRVTILAGFFVFVACVYSVFAFIPGLLDSEFQVQVRGRWPRLIPLYAAIIAYEWALRGGIGWMIRRNRQPSTLLRFVNAFVETSIPTVFLAMAVSLLGPQDAFAAPAFLFYFFFIVLSILQLDMRLCMFTGLVAAVEYFVFASMTIAMMQPESQTSVLQAPPFHFHRSLIFLAAGLIAGLLARQIKLQYEVSLRRVQERDQAVRIFGQYVSPQIAEKLLNQPVALDGELRNVCVMFLDIRNFSRYAAGESPKAVMAYLNTLFDFMIDIVNEHQGIVNKFLGDGFMAVFGAPIEDPKRCRHAVDASLEIVERLHALNAAGKIHPTRVGVGLHLGEVVTGNVGSTRRKEYTIIGDVVNMASRIEQATKELQAQILISEALQQSLGEAAYEIEDLGPVVLRGQAKPSRIFKVA